MAKPYKYNLRSGYGSDKLLLEFVLDSSDSEFCKDLLETLEAINPKIDSIDDLWINDELLLNVSSDVGAFLISKDVWDFAFIMAENNQSCIKLIDEILSDNSLFQKRES